MKCEWSFHEHRQHPGARPVYDLCLNGRHVGSVQREDVAVGMVAALREASDAYTAAVKALGAKEPF